MTRIATTALAAALLATCLPATAQVTVTEPWARATAAAQTNSAAFMTIRSATDATLVGAASPAAKVVELHGMKMDGGVMRMYAIEKLPLPAGKAVELAPAGYHVMLLGLVQPLKEGAEVPLTLTVADPAGATQKVEVKATVRPLTAMPAHKGH